MNIKKYYSRIALFFICLMSVFLFLHKLTISPPCLNADEATNAYDAYSILKTGKDQYGNFMPLRFKSFGDNKLPLLTYLAVPFIKIFGLNELAIRLVNLPFVFFFPIVIYYLTNELFGKEKYSLVSSFLIAFSPGIQLLGRQAHEGYMTAFFIALTFLLLLKFIKKQSAVTYILFLLCLLIGLFGYHSSRIWAGFMLLVFMYYTFKDRLKWYFVVGLIAVISIFGITDITNNPTRIKNLLFFNNAGFMAKVYEFQSEGGSRFLYNKITIGVKEIANEYLSYFSPQFLSYNGDANNRFGLPGISPITPIEYIFILIGIYYLFRNKEKYRFLIMFMLLFSPISGALSWAGSSITRTVFIFIPIILIVAYGFISFIKSNLYYGLIIVAAYLFFNFYSWDFYLNHYPKRGVVIRSWQCGYKELATYIEKNYDNFDRFYITKKNGQPYIFLLFYLKYPPELYQKISDLSSPDEYGFGQVESFDKFIFSVNSTLKVKRSALIGFPDDFDPTEVESLKKIKVGTETIFVIKEIK
ncbi:hypothetical protein B6D29_02915 [Microgenomates bacterium UTCPR1]|nr:MAG: hypothetical protein B6D29_02915 [Microgenomates bacterium UTCPR1]